MSNYVVKTHPFFETNFLHFLKKDRNLSFVITSTVKQLGEDPFYSGLKTHKVNTSRFGKVFSSRVTGDLRILWTFENGQSVILALALGGHSGKRKVYM